MDLPPKRSIWPRVDLFLRLHFKGQATGAFRRRRLDRCAHRPVALSVGPRRSSGEASTAHTPPPTDARPGDSASAGRGTGGNPCRSAHKIDLALVDGTPRQREGGDEKPFRTHHKRLDENRG